MRGISWRAPADRGEAGRGGGGAPEEEDDARCVCFCAEGGPTIFSFERMSSTKSDKGLRCPRRKTGGGCMRVCAEEGRVYRRLV